MSDIAIKVENLSKMYRLGDIGTGSLGTDFTKWWAKVRGKEDPFAKIAVANDRSQKSDSNYVWSLKNLDFEIKKGDAVGIIGKNGAGKSTLLKILSRTTSPTTGSVKINGRVASLLEVGTGFHGDLTGKENIYMNGSILGMTRREITSKLAEIVEFSGVAGYIDTPVKRYSSGMYVRLAFAVAAHLEPEILIVDEVLAVGDADFQRKCIGKMREVNSQDGRTVLFVSHNMAAVKQLCNKGILLQNGQLSFSGNHLDTIAYYQSVSKSSSVFDFEGDFEKAIGIPTIKILQFKVQPAEGKVLTISSGIIFEVVLYNTMEDRNLDITFELKTVDDTVVFHHGTSYGEGRSRKGVYKVTGEIPPYYINAGNYSFDIILGENQRVLLFKKENIIQFEVLNEAAGSNSSTAPGVLRPNLKYQVNFENKLI